MGKRENKNIDLSKQGEQSGAGAAEEAAYSAPQEAAPEQVEPSTEAADDSAAWAREEDEVLRGREEAVRAAAATAAADKAAAASMREEAAYMRRHAETTLEEAAGMKREADGKLREARLLKEEAEAILRDGEGRGGAEEPVSLDGPNRRELLAGTVLELNGARVKLLEDAFVEFPGADDEATFAALLVRDRRNLDINKGALRLVYDPMTGGPAPLAEQRLTADEMTERERALFGIRPPAPPAEGDGEGAGE